MNISYFDEKPLLSKLDFKLDILEKYAKNNIDSLNNMIFYGLPASGKTTKIYAFLATLFNTKVYDLKNNIFEEDRKIMHYKSSIYHIEINPINLGSNEKLFIQSFLKSYVETRNIGLDIPKVIVIKNANLLLKQTQLSLRRIIEKNSSTAKFIFELNSLSKFAVPLVSRCFLIKIEMPKIDEIKIALQNYSIKKNVEISDKTIDEIISESNKINTFINMKKIFGYYRYYVTTGKKFKFLYYDSFYEILAYINNKRISFINLQKIRDIINELYINLIPMEELLNFIFNNIYLINKDNLDFIYKLLDLTVKCDFNMKNGNKDCLHLESYIISIMDLIQNKSV
jgi:DNA polymerase III delta prime subunit